MLSIRCANGTLTLQRIVGRPLDGERVASMNILGNRAKALVRVTGEESELGGSLWQGEVDDAGQLARVIGSGQGTITVDIDGEDEIGIAPSQEAADFVRNCG